LDFHVLKVREDLVADPRDGSEHARVVIESPDWVNIIPVTPQGKVVLIRQFRSGIWSDTLEIPGGMVESGEKPIDAAKRELEEETGYRPGQVDLLGFVHPNPAIQPNRCYSYLAVGCEKVHQGRQDAGEDILIELFERAEVPRLILTGEITHALVVCAFHLEALRAKAGGG
jgi:8-oxo-dGTP pyrophosphatase MutT (NUDIX family)